MTKISNQYSLTNVLTADPVNGRVGIGTTSPLTNLMVGDGAVTQQPYISLARTATGGYWAGIRWYDGTTVKSYIQEDSDYMLRFGTANTLRMVINASGNVGIGTDSPLNVTTNRTSVTINGTSTSILSFGSGGVGKAYIYNDGTNLETFSAGALIYNTAGSERMRITSGGDLLLGATSKASARMEFRIGGTSNGAAIILGKSGSSTAGFGVDTGYTPYWECYQTGVGVYVVNVTGGVVLNQGATSWSSASDINLKDISGNINNALSKLHSLNGVNFTWKSDKDKVLQVGLIAQEVQEVLPEAVSTDRNNNLTVRYTEVIPLLVESIKELSAQASEQQLQINELKALLNA